MTTLLAVITAYSLLFGLLSWLHIRSVGSFALIVVYVTAIALTQWSPLGGRSPYLASSLLGGLLGVAAVCASLLTSSGWQEFLGCVMSTAMGCLAAFVVAGLLGFGLGGLLDISALLVELAFGVPRKRANSPTGTWPWRTRDQLAQKQPWSRTLRLTVLTLLVFLFALAVWIAQIEPHMQ